jgi:hypothetical protein
MNRTGRLVAVVAVSAALLAPSGVAAAVSFDGRGHGATDDSHPSQWVGGDFFHSTVVVGRGGAAQAHTLPARFCTDAQIVSGHTAHCMVWHRNAWGGGQVYGRHGR